MGTLALLAGSVTVTLAGGPLSKTRHDQGGETHLLVILRQVREPDNEVDHPKGLPALLFMRGLLVLRRSNRGLLTY
ncbi:hypothetical protein ACFQY0_16210 [Haloferula chungangensis]|uniref:Secreted protein n=1 Tax=Haloferula chungangensis TaxID=1048331 RepID=A0ABW2LAX6_9BACT